MGVIEKAHLFIYRFAEKGLEVFMQIQQVNSGPEQYLIPRRDIEASDSDLTENDKMIQLEMVDPENGETIQAVAIEADWHDLPAISSMVRHDVQLMKNRLKEVLPDLEKGSYIAIKDAFKRSMPNQYALLKELKEILTDRNLIKYL
ncbi:MAG: hypothetical protein ABIV51_14425 [Saprospiraceae bacterium]